MSADTMPIIKLGVPKGSLEDATINLFERAGWKIRKHTRNYFPDINDPQISASLCRVQEIGEYIEAGVLDVGITGLDWLTERNHEDKVVRVSDLSIPRPPTAPAAGCWPWRATRPTRQPPTLRANALPPSFRA